MKKILLLIVVLGIGLVLILKVNKENMVIAPGQISVFPISHASMILDWDGTKIYIDPVDEAKANIFAGKPVPDIILLTDIHGDHFDVDALGKITKDQTIIIAPKSVADMLPNTIPGTLLLMNNGEKTNGKTKEKMNLRDFSVEAIPMYNLPESATSFHVKGRGNGYVVEKDGKRIYISGDSAGIPEMRNLQNIDMAFVAMNLPYTMGVEEAAEAVLAFKPKKVYPYHYRTKDGFSDVAKFKELVNKGDSGIEVILLEWYPK